MGKNNQDLLQKYGMYLPKMILFDYGQTLGNEKFNGLRGTEAVLDYAIENKYNRTAVEVQAAADEINRELGRFDPEKRHQIQVEMPNYMFTNYLYESQGFKLSISGAEIDKVFWDASSPAVPTEGIEEFLEFLHRKGIRTGVISNITYDGKVVEERINTLLPDHHFEFIIATSDYFFRKPNKRIFELALQRAGLESEDVWYIGDQYAADVEGARNAKITPVWYIGAIDLPYEEKKDVLTVRSWAELKGYLDIPQMS